MQSSSRNGAKVIWLAVHTTEGIMRAVDLRAWTTWLGSSHAANDETGVLLSGAADGFVDYDRAAWTLRNGNPISDNLEQCGWARWTRAEWLARPKLLDTTARWLADRHKARPWIPLVKLSPADVKARKPGVLGHGDYSTGTGDGTHWDPGPNYPWDVVLDKARAYASGSTLQEDFVSALNDDQQRDLYNTAKRIEAALGLLPIPIWNDRGAVGEKTARQVLGEIHAAVTGDGPAVSAGSFAGLSQADLDAVAEAVNDEKDRRERDGDPSTGPTS